MNSLRIYRSHLAILYLSDNLIETYESLDCLKDFEHLQKIDLRDNKLPDSGEALCRKLFEIFPQLKIANQRDKNGQEVQSEEEDEFPFGEGGEDEFYENMFMGEEGEDDIDGFGESGEEGSKDDREEGEARRARVEDEDR